MDLVKKLQELLDNQTQKYFCIFTGDGDQVTCEVDQMPPFTVDRYNMIVVVILF
jgi:hypothetical protein